MTLIDIIDELSKPTRDPRKDIQKPVLRSDVLKFAALTDDIILTGTVRNVINSSNIVKVIKIDT